MADDGMLLNFDLGDAPLVTKQTFKGGRWKDRLTAKKAAQRREKKTANPDATNGTEPADQTDPRPVKRQRVDDQFAQPWTNGAPARPNAAASKKGPQKQFVSSLFTFNPESTTQNEPKLEMETDEQFAPSNAPLSAELETFTSLGLSPTLASHLLHKLDIKAPTAIQKSAIPQLVKDDSDAFIQAQTGSGKTLAYVLPIVQRLVALGKDNVHRDSGLFAIILAPTRELSKQISVVLENVLRATNWLVSGTVIGGEKKKSEKARVRKGLNILVATPGRLVDHLEHTEALDVGNVRWLVLDEGDRLMELGFENDIQKIVGALNLRMKASKSRIPGLPTKRMTILCSATMKMDVQRLGEISLKEATHIKNEGEEEAQESTFSAPAQLRQSYAVVPAKLRLVTLVAVLKRAFARKGSVMKVIVFISCADSVEFHFEVLARDKEEEKKEHDSKDEKEKEERNKQWDRKRKDFSNFSAANRIEPVTNNRTSAPSPTLSTDDNPVTVYKLHGSLAQSLRTSTLQNFTKSTTPAVLVCTDVASRGLDLPNVDFVIEYDPAFARDDHLHRIGRTARAGKEGRAMLFLQPGDEEGYVSILRQDRPTSTDSGATTGLVRHDANELLRKAFLTGGLVFKQVWEDAATNWQLDAERWALGAPGRLELARRAYQSHIRAYATHIAAERVYFNIKELHLGHLAKAFALRDRPGSIKVPGLRPDAAKGKEEKGRRVRERAAEKGGEGKKKGGEVGQGAGGEDVDAVGRRMRAMARKMMGAGAAASEFNLG